MLWGECRRAGRFADIAVADLRWDIVPPITIDAAKSLQVNIIAIAARFTRSPACRSVAPCRRRRACSVAYPKCGQVPFKASVGLVGRVDQKRVFGFVVHERQRHADIGAFVLGLRVVITSFANSIRVSPVRRADARGLGSRAGTVKANSGCALLRIRAGRAVRQGANAEAITPLIPAVILGIKTPPNKRALAIDLVADRRAARLTSSGARRIAAEPVDAESGDTLHGLRAGRAIGQSRLHLIAHPCAVTFAGIAFIVGVLAIADMFANAVEAVSLFGRGASHAGARANVAATKPVDAIVRQALFGRGTSNAIVELALAEARTSASPAFFFRIGIVEDRGACAVDTISCFCVRAGHTGFRTCRIAAYTVDAETGRAIRSAHTRRPIGLERLRLITRAGTIAFAGNAFIVGVDVCGGEPALAIKARTLFGRAARLAQTIADVVAANAFDAIVRQTVRGTRTGHAVVLFAMAVARTGSAETFVFGIGIVLNGAAGSIRTNPLELLRASLTNTGTSGIATDTIDAMAGRALRGGSTCDPISLERLLLIARSHAVAFTGIALVIGIETACNDLAHAVVPVPLFGRRTC